MAADKVKMKQSLQHSGMGSYQLVKNPALRILTSSLLT